MSQGGWGNRMMRREAQDEWQETLLDDTPVLPIYWYTTTYLIRPEVKNWHPLLLNNHPFKFVKIEKD